MRVLTVLGDVSLLAGVSLTAAAALGLLRLPDVYTRASAIAKAGSLGIVLVLLGELALQPGWENAGKVAVAVVLQLVTAPVSSLAIGRAAHRSGAPPAAVTRYDDLAVERRFEPPRPGGA